jgi:6-phosphogluconolactonase
MKILADKTVWKNSEAMSVAAAHFFVAACHQAIAKQGRFSVALSGGSTPRRLYELLATPEFNKNIPWKNVFLFWSDERFVPHTSPESNYNMVKESLLDHIDIPPRNIFPVPISGNPDQCARQYEMNIKKFFDNKPPSFDWILLGTGADGHTASLFPNTPVLAESRRSIKEVWVADKQTWRITFSFPLINRSKQIIFLVAGKEKAHVINAVFNKRTKKIFPVQYVNPEKSMWMLDEKAVDLL